MLYHSIYIYISYYIYTHIIYIYVCWISWDPCPRDEAVVVEQMSARHGLRLGSCAQFTIAGEFAPTHGENVNVYGG